MLRKSTIEKTINEFLSKNVTCIDEFYVVPNENSTSGVIVLNTSSREIQDDGWDNIFLDDSNVLCKHLVDVINDFKSEKCDVYLYSYDKPTAAKSYIQLVAIMLKQDRMLKQTDDGELELSDWSYYLARDDNDLNPPCYASFFIKYRQ